MPTPTTIVVQDDSTSQQLTGATVFANGTSQGTTNISGALTISLPDGSTNNTISAKMPGYITTSHINAEAGAPFTLSLIPTQQATTESFTLTIYPESAAAGSFITFSNAGSPITTAYIVGGLVISLIPGPQTITGTVTGYNPINITIDSSQANDGIVQLVASTDSGTAIGQAAVPGPVTPSSMAVLPQLTPEQIPEFVAPNTLQGTYFTMTQARMYIGGLFIDELNGLQFALQDNKIPIYGYASRFFDALGQGKSLVQGQFTINFISEGYLYLVLKQYQTMQIQGDVPTNQAAKQAQANLTSLVNALQNPDPAWTPDMIATAKAQIQSYAASLGPDAVNAARQGIGAAQQQQIGNTLGLPGGDYPNAIYTDVSFDIILQYTGAGRTVTRRLEQCTLISNESIMDHSGTPILDSYGFISRRLR